MRTIKIAAVAVAASAAVAVAAVAPAQAADTRRYTATVSTCRTAPLPDVTGMLRDDALAALSARGFNVVRVTVQKDGSGVPDYATWIVVAQYPAAGTYADQCDEVIITLGEPPVAVSSARRVKVARSR